LAVFCGKKSPWTCRTPSGAFRLDGKSETGHRKWSSTSRRAPASQIPGSTSSADRRNRVRPVRDRYL
jgi:hypothetical protein